MNEQATKMTDRDDPLEMSALMLADMVPSFTGGDAGPDVGVFLNILEQVGRLGGWRDTVKCRYYKHRINDFFRFTNILKIPARLPIYFQCKNISEQRISVQCIFQNNVHNLFARLYARNISITNLVKSSSTATLT